MLMAVFVTSDGQQPRNNQHHAGEKYGVSMKIAAYKGFLDRTIPIDSAPTMSLTRPLLTFTLTYMNYLASRPPPAPSKSKAKFMDSQRDLQFIRIASIAVTLSQVST
jgi:hypothetical protein